MADGQTKVLVPEPFEVTTDSMTGVTFQLPSGCRVYIVRPQADADGLPSVDQEWSDARRTIAAIKFAASIQQFAHDNRL